MRPVASRTTWAVVVLQQFVYLFVLHGRSGRGVAAIGLMAAAVLAVTRSVRLRFDWATWAIIAAFLLPTISLLRAPQIAFVSLDGRLWLIAAWLFAASMMLPADAARRMWHTKLPVALAVIWSSLFWLAIVSDVGVGQYMVSNDRRVPKVCQSDPLAIAFTIWEAHPPSEHLFLAWRTYESLTEHHPYANHVHPYLFLMYAWTWLARVAARIPLFVATNTVPVLYIVILVAAVFTLLSRARLLPDAPDGMRLGALFTACGLLVTIWRFWNDLLRYNSDNPYPLIAAMLIFTFAALIEPVNRRLMIAGVVGLAALSPIHTPMLVVTLACLFWPTPLRTGAADARLLATAIVMAVFVGAVVYLLPWELIRWKGYTPEGSSFLLRSGLDGDTRYFTNMLQAVIAPCPTGCCWSRTWEDLLFPAFVPLVGFVTLRRGQMASAVSLGRLSLFLLAPYLFSTVLFPQSISIHPYLYDHMVIIPITVVAIVVMFEWLADEGLEAGPKVLGLILLAGGVIMSNLIAIAQSLARMAR